MDNKKQYPQIELSLEEDEAVDRAWDELRRAKDLEEAEKQRGNKVKSLRDKYRKPSP